MVRQTMSWVLGIGAVCALSAAIAQTQERDRPREGDRPAGERRRDGDRPEGRAPREGDRPAGERRRDGDRPDGRGPRDGRPMGHPLMRLFDTDRDGVISEKEIKNASAVLLKMDRNKDGKLTPEEMPAPPGFGPGGPRGPRPDGPPEGRQDSPPRRGEAPSAPPRRRCAPRTPSRTPQNRCRVICPLEEIASAKLYHAVQPPSTSKFCPVM